ncbi:MAG: circularly permuted type 2 ATP-grasp protein [Opitutaceae bacterium]
MSPPQPGSSSARDGGRDLAARLRRGVRELDAAYTIGAVPEAERLEWSISPQPILIEAAEWRTIEAAVRQRARLVNCLLDDLYGKQETLRHRLLPPELVLADPFFRRACAGLEPGRASKATLLRFDLARTAAGGWMFLETFANTPIGAAFAVQNRRLMLQENAEYYAALPDFQRIIDFPVRLLDHLRRLAPGGNERPNIVVLTAGPHDPAYLEHSFLARKMGLPLAQGGDLFVLEQRVYFKTVAGLVPVDVVYRRINDSDVDPVVFPTSLLTGIPGLIGSIRAGRVAVANAIGAGVADSRALEAYFPRLLRFFLGERPVLPGVPTLYCGDIDQLAVVRDDTEARLSLEPAQVSRADLPRYARGGSPRERKRALGAMRRQPHACVARDLPEPGALQAPRPARQRLSCFALCEGRRIEVMSGGLLRFLPVKLRTDPPGWQAGDTADLVVLSPGDGPPAPEPGRPPERVKPLLLGSRAADSLFWAGRYAERAEGTARILSIIGDVGLEEISRRERPSWFPVWQGVLEATGHGGVMRPGGPAWFTPALAWHMTLDANNPSSLLRAAGSARYNTLQCRDYFSPETWGVINRLCEALDDLARGTRTSAARRMLAREAVGRVLDGFAAFFGTADRTMLHDTGWQFFQTGMHLERALMTCASLKHALLEAEAAERDNRREDADLTALVRMLSSQDAYRRTYHARTEPLFVAELFLLNRQAPKSIHACLDHVSECLATVSRLTGQGDDPPLAEVRAILTLLDGLDLGRVFSQRTDSPRFERGEGARRRATVAVARMVSKREGGSETLAGWLDRLLDRINNLGTALHDFYFSHEARLAPGTGAET